MLRSPRALLGFVLLLGACAGDGPQPTPLYAPLAETKTHGYAETALPGDRIEVSYLGPTREVPYSRTERQSYLKQARTEAEELALWRAARIAVSRGSPALRIADRRVEVNVELRNNRVVHGYTQYGYRRHRGFGIGNPGYFSFFPYPPYSSGFPDAYAQARAILKVEFTRPGRAGAIDARATEARLQEKYRNATSQPSN